MCKFKSGIVVPKSGGGFDFLHNEWTDSHEDLIRIFKLRDTARPNGDVRFARVEFAPDSMATADQIDTYKFILDEQRRPEWFTDKIEKGVIERMRLIVSRMIISGDADLLCGGAFILAKGAKIATAKNALIHVMCESSNVGVMWGSSNVGEMRGSSNVGEMWESSNVGVMWESSNVGEMWGSSNVGVMRESSKVGEMRGSSNVGEMWESSNVGEMWESSNVGEMWESSKVPEGKKPTMDYR